MISFFILTQKCAQICWLHCMLATLMVSWVAELRYLFATSIAPFESFGIFPRGFSNELNFKERLVLIRWNWESHWNHDLTQEIGLCQFKTWLNHCTIMKKYLVYHFDLQQTCIPLVQCEMIWDHTSVGEWYNYEIMPTSIAKLIDIRKVKQIDLNIWSNSCFVASNRW